MASVESQMSQQSKVPLQNDNENAEQLATLAEGKVADAVKGTSSRDKPRKDDIKIEDYTSDLEKFVLICSSFSIGMEANAMLEKSLSRPRPEKRSRHREKQV